MALIAPQAGTYYYGACVSNVPGESNVANNCSKTVAVEPDRVRHFTDAGDRLQRLETAVKPRVDPVGHERTDMQYFRRRAERGGAGLMISSITSNDSILKPGASFTLKATIHNQSNDASGAATLRWHRSPDSSISSKDASVGKDAVRSLSPNASSAETVTLKASVSPGVYCYGACLASVGGASRARCSKAACITVATDRRDSDSAWRRTIAPWRQGSPRAERGSTRPAAARLRSPRLDAGRCAARSFVGAPTKRAGGSRHGGPAAIERGAKPLIFPYNGCLLTTRPRS